MLVVAEAPLSLVIPTKVLTELLLPHRRSPKDLVSALYFCVCC